MLGDDCVYVDGEVMKSAEWDEAQEKKNSDNSAKMNIEEYQKQLEWCNERSGSLNNKWQCLCGGVIMTADSHTCKDGKIQNKK